jgi:ribose transport system ATP-binding protein
LVGIGGLRGQGQRDLLLSLFGDIHYSGVVKLFDNEVRFKHPRDAMKVGVALVPGDRAKEGLLYIRSILKISCSWKQHGTPLKTAKQTDANRCQSEFENGWSGEPAQSVGWWRRKWHRQGLM